MTIEEIRKGAPEGATHYKMSRCFKGQPLYYKKVGRNASLYGSATGWSAPIFLLDNLKPL